MDNDAELLLDVLAIAAAVDVVCAKLSISVNDSRAERRERFVVSVGKLIEERRSNSVSCGRSSVTV